MIIKVIENRKAFDTFVESNASVHYMKTSAWGEFKKKTEQYEYRMIGFFKNDQLCGTALLLMKTWMMHKYAYIPKGPCIDYSDLDLRNNVFHLLKLYAEQENFDFLRLDPNVIRVSRDINGNLVDGINNEDFTEEMISNGFKHKGYGYAYDGSWTNRYTLIIDISRSFDQIQKSFTKPRKTSLNRHKISGVSTSIGGIDDINDLMLFEKQLSSLDGFKPHSYTFFRTMLETFEDHAHLYVTKINLQQMIDGISSELNSKKYAKDPEARASKEKDLKYAEELFSRYGSELKIACGLFINYGTFSWDLYTYNHKEFNFIKPVDNLHCFAIQDMKSRGVNNYDMCGFSGVTTKDDPEYGLYNYKRSFGPEFIEHIGELDYPVHFNAYNRFLKEKKIEVRIRRKYWRIRYKKRKC